MRSVFVLTNHTITFEQSADLKENWQASHIIELPPELKKYWSEVPANIDDLQIWIEPIYDWLSKMAVKDSLIWVQGEWGATVSVLNWCKQHMCSAIYSTTNRVATEKKTENGVSLTHIFKHVRFRLYPPLV